MVQSDFQSTAIGLLDAQAEVLTECWIDSGSRAPGLVAALSGDVVLSTDQPAGVMTVIDRFGTDVYSRVSLETPEVLGQVRLQDPAVSGAFSANPHDAVAVGPGSVWVSRFAGNANADAPPIGRGSDLLELDPRTFTRTGRRISLEGLIEPVMVDTDDGPEPRDAYPRPSRIVRIADRLVVGLARFTLGFDGAAPGAVAIVDPDSGSVRRHFLDPGVFNCGRVVPIPAAEDQVVVGCIGFSMPFGDEAQIRASSGIFVLRVEGDNVTTVRRWLPSEDPSAPLAVVEVVALDERTVAALDYGRPGPDRYFIIDLETGDSTLFVRVRSGLRDRSGRVFDEHR